MRVSDFIDHAFHHFNAGTLRRAAHAFATHVNGGGKMVVTLAGGLSTGRIGIMLAEMIRQGKVHMVVSTAANLEEDLFLWAFGDTYVPVIDYSNCSLEQEAKLLDLGYNRVTDVAIPENGMRLIEKLWINNLRLNVGPLFPYERIWMLFDELALLEHHRCHGQPKEHSWVLAAKQHGVPIYTPGWEDCTLANMTVAEALRGDTSVLHRFQSGLEAMIEIAGWYQMHCNLIAGEPVNPGVGFFQIGGGISGDFPICAVPMLRQDLGKDYLPHWSYFCQIGDSQESYGGYSGAKPSEKITWDKVSPETPMFDIKSDASIVAPLIFAYVLGW